MNNFEDIYETMIGQRVPEAEAAGVVSIAGEGTPYSNAWQELMEARISLARRFGMAFEDKDLERIMAAVTVIERETALGMYRTGER